jgi:hypothetical protein
VQPLPIYSDLDAGAFLLQEHHDARVTSTSSDEQLESYETVTRFSWQCAM